MASVTYSETNLLKADAITTLKPGKYRYGVQFLGCFNTGTDIAIYRPRSGSGQRWIVGPSLDIIKVLIQSCRKPHQRIFDLGNGRKAYAFKGRAPAVAKWLELNNRQILDNAEMAREARELRQRASVPGADGIKAAMELADLV